MEVIYMVNKFSKGLISVGVLFAVFALFTFSLGYAEMITSDNPSVASHVSSIDVQPQIIDANQNDVFFDSEVCNDPGSDHDVHEYRVYYEFEDASDFSDVNCSEKDGWDLAILNTVWGEACIYSSESSSASIGPGECENFNFTADTPETECCRTFRFETRDSNQNWYPHNISLCVDDTAPETTKSFSPEGTYKVENGVEWIDTATEIEMQATDDIGPHDSGINGTYYRNILMENEMACEQPAEYCSYNENDFYTETCERWDCLGEGDVQDFMVSGRSDASNWDLAIGVPDTSDPATTEATLMELPWTNGGSAVPFTVSYDPSTGAVTYSVNGEEITTSYDLDKAFEYLVIMSKGKHDNGDECDMSLTNLKVNGNSVSDVVSSGNYEGLQVYMSDAMQVDGFTVTGMASMDWDAGCKNQEIPAMNIFAMETHDNPWEKYEGPFKKNEESCHMLNYFSEDGVGNVEEINSNCFFVDKKPPVPEKDVSEPKVPEGETETIIMNDNPDAPTVTVDKTYDCEKVVWDFEIEDPGCDWGHTEFGLVVGFSEDQAEFQVGTGQMFGAGSPPIYQPCDGDMSGPYGCWDGTSPSTDLPDGIVVENPGGTGEPGYGDRVFHVEIPLQYLNNGDFYWSLSSDAWNAGCTSEEGNQQYPTDWDKWSGAGIYADAEVGDCWITQDTNITITCTDQEPHPSQGEEVCYKVSFDQTQDLTEDYCNGLGGTLESGYCCVDAAPQNPFVLNFGEDSNHTIDYFCRDAVNKTSNVHTQYYRVDDTPPVIEKDMIGEDHLGDCPSGTDIEHGDCYVKDDGENGVNITVYDDNSLGCAVDKVQCTYNVTWMDQVIESGEFSENAEIIFDRDSTHTINIHCEDELGNEVSHSEEFLVDSTPPETVKNYLGPHFEFEGVEWIDTASRVNLSAEDEKVGVESTWYRVSLADDSLCESETACNDWDSCNPQTDECEDQSGFQRFTDPFGIENESCHVIEFFSTDRLFNTEPMDWQCVFVDKTAPVPRAETGDPSIECSEGEPCDEWIRQDTEVNLNCAFAQEEPHPAPLDKIEYRYRVDEGNWTEWVHNEAGVEGHDVVFTFDEDSVHELQYKCNDTVGKTSDVYTKVYKVDDTPPSITKVMNGPWYGDCPPTEEGDECYVDNATTVDVTTEDGGEICAVGNVQCRWRYKLLDILESSWTDWMSLPIRFPEESLHEVQVQCWDELNNTANDYELFISDHTPPGVGKTYEGPYVSGSMDGGWAEWISSETKINVNVIDDGPHKSGIKNVEYRTTIVDDEYCVQREVDEMACENARGSGQWAEASNEFNFSIGEESCHLIEVNATDNVDKNKLHKQCVFVDNSGPETNKTVGEPKEPWDGLDANFYNISEFCTEQGNCWKTTILTPIKLGCVDPEPHPVNNNNACYKVELDGDDMTDQYCGEQGLNEQGYCCVDAGSEFTFGETSEHNLEYYCEDALGNTGSPDDEKFKVEEDAFNITINKKWNLISTPVFLLDDAMEQVFDGASDCVKSVWTYDPLDEVCENDWCVFTPDETENDDLNTMLPGWGYWVLAEEDCSLMIGGSLMRPGPVGQASKEIVDGWNLIGYYGTEGEDAYDGPDGNGKDAECALYSLGEDIWDKEFTGLFSYWEPNNPNSWLGLGKSDNMDPGAGYWLSTPQQGYYAPTSVCEGD